jgi:signal transduction histidine kinase
VQNKGAPGRFLPAATTLSAIVGHELNNIAVPLQGFIDLASEAAALSTPVQDCFKELRNGVDRMRSLAFELESLATATASPVRISIGECLREADWRCDPATAVLVDPFHARLAIDALRRVGRNWRNQDSAAELTVAQEIPVNPVCAACGKSLRRFGRSVLVQVHDARLSRVNAIRKLIGPDGSERTARAVTLAVLMHSSHRAGGHIVTDEQVGLVGLALPSA